MTISTLGTFEFTADGCQVPRWRAGKARHLLAFLLLHKNRVMTVDALYDALWPDVAWSRTSSSLKVAVHMLRTVLVAQNQKAMRACVGDEEPPFLRLATHELGYILKSHNVWVDFEVFDDLTNRAFAACAQGAFNVATQSLGAAMEIYKGDFMPGVSLGWAEAERAWLQGRAVMALQRMIQCCAQAGDYIAAADYCYTLLQIEPFCEEVYQALMTIHGHLGHLGHVQRWYEICVKRLRTELQIEPMQMTHRLHQSAMRGEFIGASLQEVPCLNTTGPDHGYGCHPACA